MSPLALTLAFVRRRPWGTALNVVLLALGVGSIVALILVGGQLDRTLARNAEGIDLVVGAKGSPLQLVLSAVYHADAPTGNVPVSEVEAVLASPAVASWVPLALGDSYRGRRVVGTTAAYPALYGAEPASGRLWAAEGEVTLGADVARDEGLAVGDEVVTSHGLTAGGEAHGGHPLRVVGVLAPTGTVVDRLVLTAVETVWAVHDEHGDEDEEHGEHDETVAHNDEHDELESDGLEANGLEANGLAAPPGTASGPPPGFGVPGLPGLGAPAEADDEPEYTAALVRYASPLAAISFPRFVNAETNLQAASPALETQRLLGLLGVGLGALRVFGLVLVAAAVLGVAIGLYNAMRERRTDLAVMRTLGASRRRVVAQVLLEGVLLAGAGTALGVFLGHVAVAALVAASAGTRTPLPVTAWTVAPAEVAIAALAVAVGALAALVPAVQAYRTDVARTLSQG